MQTVKSGSWTSTFNDAGQVIDLETTDPSIVGPPGHLLRVLLRINADMHAGIAPAIEHWGIEVRRESVDGAWFGMSYLSLVWNALEDDRVTEADRRRELAWLQRRYDATR